MQPVIKGFDCIDLDPIEDWTPRALEDVHYELCLHIGSQGDIGVDYFHVDILTPQAINRHNLGSKVRKHSLIINPYSWEAVLSKIETILTQCEGSDWSQCAILLAKHFRWEFDNYKPY